MNDMRSVIVPKSDQINADDLLAGPMTIIITDVTIRPGTEQPVSIHFDGDGGKPFKPCKSMARVMVHCWGPDANQYKGRRMTLYCDPKVKWGGMEVGGIRISHMSDISGSQVMALTITKGSRKPFTVQPLPAAPTTKAKSQPAAAAATEEDPDDIKLAEDIIGFFQAAANSKEHLELVDANGPQFEWLKNNAPRTWREKVEPAIKANWERHQAADTQEAAE